jgi:hypothetical protein
MKLKTLASILLLVATVGCSSTTAIPSNNSTALASPVPTRFFCANDLKGIPTTYAQTQRGRVSVIKWVSEYFKNAGYDPQKRCQEVSSQFEKLYREGKLNYLSAGRKNDETIICGLSASNGYCEQLFTLKPGENAGRLLQQLRDIATGKASGPLFAGGVVDMNQFLKKAPVEP